MQVKTNGFTLLEILAVIMLIGIMAAIVIPRIGQRPIALRKQITREINTITRNAQLSALMTGKTHRVVFDTKNGAMRAEIEEDKPDSQGKKIFKPLHISYVKTEEPLHPDLIIEKFMIKGKNIIHEGEGVQHTQAWFFIVPDGIIQEVTIGLYDKEKNQHFSLIANPFTGHFALE